jgi:hypothetical protein
MESTNLPDVLSWLGGFEWVHGWFAFDHTDVIRLGRALRLRRCAPAAAECPSIKYK